MENMEELKSWIKSKHGNLTKLSDAVGRRPTSVFKWKQVPAEHVLKVEALTGISRHTLRPDVYGPVKGKKK